MSKIYFHPAEVRRGTLGKIQNESIINGQALVCELISSVKYIILILELHLVILCRISKCLFHYEKFKQVFLMLASV